MGALKLQSDPFIKENNEAEFPIKKGVKFFYHVRIQLETNL